MASMPTNPEPPVDPIRLADAVTALAGRSVEPEVRVQLHALSGLVRNLGVPAVSADERAALEAEIERAIARDDEPAAIAAMRRLATLERAPIRPVDWSAASGG
jgi:hypothetical protein